VFASDSAVLQSLRGIVFLDKTKLVPREYARVLESDIKFHFLEEPGATLNTVDHSEFNIIISNTQKIVVRKKQKDINPADALFTQQAMPSPRYGGNARSDEGALRENGNLTVNQRFMKLCRLNNLGIYVDEAHHLFGAKLKKQLRPNAAHTSLRSAISLLALELKISGKPVVACFNYIGTPYVQNQVLPEVVYAHGLRESVCGGFLKECEVQGLGNGKSEDFLRAAISRFWKGYGGKTYDGLMPKLAIFAASIDEAINEVQPAVEKILVGLGVSPSAVLLNASDRKYAGREAIRHFNNLDAVGTGGSRKQFLILVRKGCEGWACRSLFGAALLGSPPSKTFILQAVMGCLRKITEEQQRAMVFLSEEDFGALNDELNKNFNLDSKGLKRPGRCGGQRNQAGMPPPPGKIRRSPLRREYVLVEKGYNAPVDFGISELDLAKYETAADKCGEKVPYSQFTLVGEIARYLNLSPVLINRILTESADGAGQVVGLVNKYDAIIRDVLVPKIWNALFEVTYIGLPH
jgi:hypothetical protein